MSYTVLARKYRPQVFADLVGQEHVSRTLANAIKSGRVAHAFLFTGARGVGKTTTARLLAKALNCEKGPTPEPCNQCDPCREITVGTDLDVLEIDGASNNGVDDVRRLQESLPYRPARDRFKVVIVDEVHMLSTGAFNAFLKTLEEPPSHVKFIFATTEIHKVPITIRSRCQRHDFRLIPHAQVTARVREILAQEKIEADDDAVAIVVREAGGSLRDALTVLDQLLAFGGDGLRGEDVARGLAIADQRSVMSAAAALLEGDAAACLRCLAGLSDQGLDMLHFARQLLALLRDLVVLRVVGPDSQLVDRSEDDLQKASELARAHAPEQLERTFAGLSQLVDEVGQSATPQLVLEMGLVRLANRPPLQPLKELLARLAALEERMKGGSGGGASEGRGSSGPPSGPPRGAPRRMAPSDAPAPHELRAPKLDRPQAIPTATVPMPMPMPMPVPVPVPVPDLSTTTTTTATTTATQDAGQGDIPVAWGAILDLLKGAQPALCAVLEHAVPVQIDASRIVLSFPDGSFFGRQASAEPAQRALAEAAARVLGARPRIEIASGLPSSRPTVAAQLAAQKKERRAEVIEAALNHPRVKEAMDVFPEAEGQVDVQVLEAE